MINDDMKQRILAAAQRVLENERREHTIQKFERQIMVCKEDDSGLVDLTYDEADAILELLKKQEPLSGFWTLDDEDTNSWECSECGGLFQINEGSPYYNDFYFCPYCGAKNIEGELE